MIYIPDTNSPDYLAGYNDGRTSEIDRRKYNGWTNYETWNCDLWIDQDEGLAETCREMCLTAESVYDASESLKSLIDETCFTVDGISTFGMARDMLNASFSEINFYEIAQNIRGE